MQLWIREQSGMELIKTKAISINEQENGKWLIETKEDQAQKISFQLGKYSTKERALQLLDIIQEELVLSDGQNNTIVYNMPKE
jgi:hypothetical protein